MDYYDEVVEIKNRPQQSSGRQRSGKNVAKEAEPATTTTRSIAAVNDDAERTTQKRPASSLPRKASQKIDRIPSDTESSDSETEKNPKFSAEGFDYMQWEHSDVPSDIKELYQFIPRYSAAKTDIPYSLQPFIPDFIPAVGDVDAFLKVIPSRPLSEKSRIIEFIDRLGFEMLDEPCGEQSEPALLHMKLRSVSMSNTRAPGPPPAISKSSKDTEKWIAEVQALHANQPYPTVVHNRLTPDIDSLMVEWPAKMEQTLNNIGFPNAQLDCSLKFYIELVCGLFDISIPNNPSHVDYLLALNTLFNLYLAVKNPIE